MSLSTNTIMINWCLCQQTNTAMINGIGTKLISMLPNKPQLCCPCNQCLSTGKTNTQTTVINWCISVNRQITVMVKLPSVSTDNSCRVMLITPLWSNWSISAGNKSDSYDTNIWVIDTTDTNKQIIYVTINYQWLTTHVTPSLVKSQPPNRCLLKNNHTYHSSSTNQLNMQHACLLCSSDCTAKDRD